LEGDYQGEGSDEEDGEGYGEADVLYDDQYGSEEETEEERHLATTEQWAAMKLQSVARGRNVLDLCCNSGGFAMNAVAGGAKSVRAADLDEEMVAQTIDNAARNGLKMKVEHADAFDLLRDLQPDLHDLVVLDPPKWIKSRDEMEQGLARYRDLNRLALEKVKRGGIVVTCSCSGSLDEGSFLRMLDEACAQAGRRCE
jgi:23S rRNA (cytosine1962-C5)-methyltransferase